MRRIGLLLVLSLLLSGCATYKFQKGASPYDKGYVVFYDGKQIPEYTIGQGSSVPELALAKERFNRRRATVEYYYKKMGQIEARFKELFWDPPAMAVDFIGGILRWPFVAVADYKYNRNPQYKEKADRLDEQKDELEKSRVNDLKAKLKAYIDEDLEKETARKGPPVPEAIAPVVAQPTSATVPIEPEKVQPVNIEPAKQIVVGDVNVVTAPVAGIPAAPVVEQAPVASIEPEKVQKVLSPEPERQIVAEGKKVLPVVELVKLEPPHAVVLAKPTKGFSPLQVNFNGVKSSSPAGRIVSYSWDFGDGDTSTKKNPANTYWSTTYGSRIFTATLTVKDEKGQTASTSINIEVVTK